MGKKRNNKENWETILKYKQEYFDAVEFEEYKPIHPIAPRMTSTPYVKNKKKNGKISPHEFHYIPSNLRNVFFPRDQIKTRNFEIPGCKTFLLTGYTKRVEDFYDIDKEIVCFKNTKELVDKIRYYLAHDGERERIAAAGYERTLRDHTYEKRFEEIFDFAKNL